MACQTTERNIIVMSCR